MHGEALHGRRRTLQVLGAGGLLLACKDPREAASGQAGPPEDCAKDIDDASRTIRRALEYRAKNENPERKCSACAQFTPGKYGACGGGCKLIPGPVKPTATCLSFAPIAAPTTPASAPAPSPAQGSPPAPIASGSAT